MRDRLIELLNKKYDHFCDQCGVNKDSHYTESLADYLLENGVIVPPNELFNIVDIGTMYATVSKAVGDWLPLYVIKNPEKYGYYRTREEAEAKLKEGAE